MVRNVIMILSNLALVGLIKEAIFCSMLYILFAPVVMWLYLGIAIGYILVKAVYKTIKIYI